VSECRGDVLISMPSYDYLRYARVPTTRALRAAAARYAVMAGFDTGSWLLAQAGLLDGRRATIHWQELQRFAETFPSVETERKRFIQDGNRITCSGAQASFDLMLDQIGQRHGQALRLEVAALFMGSEATGSGATLRPRIPKVSAALAVMQSNLEQPLPVGMIAAQVGTSQRSLEQRMQSAMGATPQSVYRRLRLIEAKRLALETNLPVSEIAVRCGYTDPSALTRAFKSEFGSTLRDLRNLQA
jgi:AraC family transcriptional regulator, carnitine catabolism transcriptional activator